MPPSATATTSPSTTPSPLFVPDTFPAPSPAARHSKLPHPILRFKSLPDDVDAQDISREALVQHIQGRHGRKAWHAYLYLQKYSKTGLMLREDYSALLQLITTDRIPSRAHYNAQHLKSSMLRRGLPFDLEDYKALMYIQLRNRDMAGVARTFEECRAVAAEWWAQVQADGHQGTEAVAEAGALLGPDLRAWAILLYSLVDLHEPARCWELWDQVCREAPQAAQDPELNAILLYGLGKAGRLELALRHLATLPADLLAHPLIRVGMIRAYGTSGRLVEAVAAFEAIPPRDRAFREHDAVLEGTCYAGHVELSEHYFEAYCTACRITRTLYDSRIITRMMELYLTAGLPHMVERHLALVQNQLTTYRQFELCIRALLQRGERRKAFKHFDKLETIGFYPDTAFLDA
jgi:hypothetical protein